MKLNNIKNVFISGASKGIGFELTKQYLTNHINVFCVARNTTPIASWAKEQNLTTYLQTFNCDLTQIATNRNLISELNKIDFDIMINNAGVSVFGMFDTTNIDDELNLIDLNIKSLQFMTKYFYLKYHKTTTEKRIINLASTAAFQPGPLHATYFASKSYVLNFSCAINFELQQQKAKLKVITLCPGPIATDFWTTANYQSKKLPPGSMSVTKFTKIAFKKINQTKKDIVLIGNKNKVNAFLARHLPRKIILKQVYKIQKAGL
ncbi:SDR family NAD(P)-dependent oxidoreductase [Spiroplasma sp. SV19]|uniref:SDR family NAD(P)-dependent oxidoreductase n=1 Tax=Spiroplasma sp. SV19 TaxID=2570468 RepID=UPI0024B81641|nr:SDR family NAD(P)-dependent oxidoreductase [Spiroplasma sp. SV19]WHQ36909.1 SDR family NAD(P)-dependent oxidoreductase [Spiroplasma sp. SV19]